jgi:hypothetical protein
MKDTYYNNKKDITSENIKSKHKEKQKKKKKEEHFYLNDYLN